MNVRNQSPPWSGNDVGHLTLCPLAPGRRHRPRGELASLTGISGFSVPTRITLMATGTESGARRDGECARTSRRGNPRLGEAVLGTRTIPRGRCQAYATQGLTRCCVQLRLLATVGDDPVRREAHSGRRCAHPHTSVVGGAHPHMRGRCRFPYGAPGVRKACRGLFPDVSIDRAPNRRACRNPSIGSSSATLHRGDSQIGLRPALLLQSTVQRRLGDPEGLRDLSPPVPLRKEIFNVPPAYES